MPRFVHRRSAGAALLSLLLAAGPAAAQAPPPEYDPGADHHFLLPTGRVAPPGTGSAGIAAAALPAGGFAYVGGSLLRRTSLRVSALIGPAGAFLGALPTLSLSVQPVAAERFQVSLTGLSGLGGGYVGGLQAAVGSASFGDDTGRMTLGAGSIHAVGGVRALVALGWDYELDSRDPRIVVIDGSPRTIRTRIKAIGELWMVGQGSGSVVIGGAGLRLSGENIFLDLVMPVTVDGGGPAFGQVPFVNLGFNL